MNNVETIKKIKTEQEIESQSIRIAQLEEEKDLAIAKVKELEKELNEFKGSLLEVFDFYNQDAGDILLRFNTCEKRAKFHNQLIELYKTKGE